MRLASLTTASARQSPATGSRSFIVETIERQLPPSRAPAPTTAVEQSAVGVQWVVATPMIEALARKIDSHQRRSGRLGTPGDAAAAFGTELEDHAATANGFE